MGQEDNVQVIEARIASLKTDIEQLEKKKKALLEQSVEDNLKISWSLDGELYYISDSLNMPKGWFGKKKIEKRPEENTAPFMGGYVQTTLKDGTTYYRKYYPFAFWSVKSDHSKDAMIALDDDLAADYVTYGVTFWDWKGYDKHKESNKEQVSQ